MDEMEDRETDVNPWGILNRLSPLLFAWVSNQLIMLNDWSGRIQGTEEWKPVTQQRGCARCHLPLICCFCPCPGWLSLSLSVCAVAWQTCPRACQQAVYVCACAEHVLSRIWGFMYKVNSEPVLSILKSPSICAKMSSDSKMAASQRLHNVLHGSHVLSVAGGPTTIQALVLFYVARMFCQCGP